MTHDPMCLDEVTCETGCCQCDLIAKVRADERRWVTSSAGSELLNHRITDGVCACGMDAPDALDHLAWVVSVYIFHDLKPKHEVQP